MRGDVRGVSRGRPRFWVKENGGVPVLRRRRGVLGDRGKLAVGPDQEEHLGCSGQRIAPGPGGSEMNHPAGMIRARPDAP